MFVNKLKLLSGVFKSLFYFLIFKVFHLIYISLESIVLPAVGSSVGSGILCI